MCRETHLSKKVKFFKNENKHQVTLPHEVPGLQPQSKAGSFPAESTTLDAARRVGFCSIKPKQQIRNEDLKVVLLWIILEVTFALFFKEKRKQEFKLNRNKPERV